MGVSVANLHKMHFSLKHFCPYAYARATRTLPKFEVFGSGNTYQGDVHFCIYVHFCIMHFCICAFCKCTFSHAEMQQHMCRCRSAQLVAVRISLDMSWAERHFGRAFLQSNTFVIVHLGCVDLQKYSEEQMIWKPLLCTTVTRLSLKFRFVILKGLTEQPSEGENFLRKEMHPNGSSIACKRFFHMYRYSILISSWNWEEGYSFNLKFIPIERMNLETQIARIHSFLLKLLPCMWVERLGFLCSFASVDFKKAPDLLYSPNWTSSIVCRFVSIWISSCPSKLRATAVQNCSWSDDRWINSWPGPSLCVFLRIEEIHPIFTVHFCFSWCCVSFLWGAVACRAWNCVWLWWHCGWYILNVFLLIEIWYMSR